MRQKYQQTFFYFLLIVFIFSLNGCSKTAEPPVDKQQGLTISFPEALFTDHLKIARKESSPIIMNRLISLVNASVNGSGIHISIFGCDYPALTTALRNAANRGVNVHLMVDMSAEDTQKENLKIVNELKNIPRIDVVIVTNDAGNIAINHNKFALFSKIETSAGEEKNVIFQTSHNFTIADSRKIQDAVVLKDQALYNAFKQYWEDIKIRAVVGMAFFDYREYIDETKGIYAYFLPKRKNNQFFGDDTIIEILEGIEEPESATIRIGMSGWTDTRLNIIEKLEDLMAQGAEIQVVTKTGISAAIESRLRSMKANGAYVKIFADSKINIHSKYMVIDAKWKGQPRQLVVNGSQNFTRNALRYNAEVTMVLLQPSIYQAYHDNFEHIKQLPE